MISVQYNKSLYKAILAGLLFSTGIKISSAADNQGSLTIRHYQIEGNNLLPEAELQAVLAPYVGEQRGFTDVQKALEALEGYYQEKGYGEVLLSLPEQELKDGIVRLQVIEPVLKSIRFEYLKPELQEHYPEEDLLETLPALQAGQPLHTQDISRNTQLANENPARQMEVVLHTTPTPGELDANVKVNGVPPRKAYATIDNTGTDQTGEYRMGFGLQHSNMWGYNHVATFNYMTPIDRPEHVNLFSGNYRIPLYNWGDSIDFTAAKSDVGNTSSSGGLVQFAGSGEIYGVNYNLLLPRLGEYSHRLVFGYNYKQYNNSCLINGSNLCPGGGSTPITLMPFSLTYSGVLSQQQQSVNFYLTVAQNLPGMTHGGQSDFEQSRLGASSDYKLFKAGYSYTALIAAGWQVRLAGNGQYSPDRLVSAEQFSLAGSTMVRGFWEREATRDMGYVLNTEVYGPNLANLAGVGDNLRGLVFYDYGSGHNNSLAGVAQQSNPLSSVGLGLRFGYNQSFQLKFDGSYVLDGAVTAGPSSHVTGDARAHLAVYMPYSF